VKVKTSISLSTELLKAVDQRAKQGKKSRSDFIETVIWAFVEKTLRDEQNTKDLEILNRRAETLNREAADVLSYQVQ